MQTAPQGKLFADELRTARTKRFRLEVDYWDKRKKPKSKEAVAKVTIVHNRRPA